MTEYVPELDVSTPIEQNGHEEVVDSAQAAPTAIEQHQEKQEQLNEKETNLRILRAKAQLADKYERELSEYKKIANSEHQKTNQAVSEQTGPMLGDDDIVEGKHVRGVEKKIKDLEQKLQQYEQQSTANNAEVRLKAQYPDIDQVVTMENLNVLKEVDPDLFMSLQYNPDIYSKGSLAYRQIKSLGIYKEDKYMKEKERVAQNTNKPRSSNSVSPQQGDSPLSHANQFADGLTQELKKKLYKEMLDCSR